MRLRDLHQLPKVRDRQSYLYVEYCQVNQQDKAIALCDKRGTTPVPCASLALLMLGPGTSITHAAITALADNGCLAAWCGEQGIRFYAAGSGATRSAANIIEQARMESDPAARMAVVRRLYQMRFRENLGEHLTLQQIRGMEGARVRDAYAKWAAETGVPWSGRDYKRDQWSQADPVNRALSAANACLYGVCTAAIIAAGYSPALGFIHTGKQLSFAYDVADLYKTEVTTPAAFKAVAENAPNIERQARLMCRDYFAKSQLLKRIVSDIARALEGAEINEEDVDPYAEDAARPGLLWDPGQTPVEGGTSFAQDDDDMKDNTDS